MGQLRTANKRHNRAILAQAKHRAPVAEALAVEPVEDKS